MNKKEKEYRRYFEILDEAEAFAEKNDIIKLGDNIYFLDSILKICSKYKNDSIIEMKVEKIIDAKKGIVSLKNNDFTIAVDFINGINEYLFKNYKDAQNMYDKIIHSIVESLKNKGIDEISKFLKDESYKKDGFNISPELKQNIVDGLYEDRRSSFVDDLTKDLLKISKNININYHEEDDYDRQHEIIDSFASKIDYNKYMNEWLSLHPGKRDDHFDEWFNELIRENFFSEIDYEAIVFLRPDNMQITKNDKYVMSVGFDDNKIKIHEIKEVSKNDACDLHEKDITK